MSKAYLGIDLGTSSVKVLCRYEDGKIKKAKARYSEISPKGWSDAVISALKSLDLSEVSAIGLSSQVGTYIINDEDVISWNDNIGADEVREIKQKFSGEFFMSEISMPHPDIVSYPIPRLMYINKKYGAGARVCQPKDYIGKMLTGVLATDKYSWRGLANLERERYSEYFLDFLGNPKLPPIKGHTELLGTVTKEISKKAKIPENTPVYTGLNDFFASIAGMGVTGIGDMFDITGTSEHLGFIGEKIIPDTKMVSGRFIENFVHYGVTASSGAALDFAISNFGIEGINAEPEFIKESPIFLPYVNGERAPIFDADARGEFFGISSKTKIPNMAYAVLEGVAFSIFHIYENLGISNATKLVVSGGAAKDAILNTVKATLYDMKVVTLAENDTSALGAAMVAAIGDGKYSGIKEAASQFCKISQVFLPDKKIRDILIKRFSIYKDLYPSLRDKYKKFKEVQL